MRSNSAREARISMPTSSSERIGKPKRVCSVVNATSVPIEIDEEPAAIVRPAKRKTRAGMIEKLIWMTDIRQRPAMRWRTSSSASSSDSDSKRRASSPARPIVLPSRIPDTDSDSATSALMSATRPWRLEVMRFFSLPTRRVTHTKTGISDRLNSARRQSSRNIATTVAVTVVTFETNDVAVVVTTFCTPPMSLAMRDCTSPVRVRVKNDSDSFCRWT